VNNETGFPRVVVGHLGTLRVVHTREELIKHNKFTIWVAAIFGVQMIVGIAAFAVLLFKMAIIAGSR
jgi:hypothetical protein